MLQIFFKSEVIKTPNIFQVNLQKLFIKDILSLWLVNQ